MKAGVPSIDILNCNVYVYHIDCNGHCIFRIISHPV